MAKESNRKLLIAWPNVVFTENLANAITCNMVDFTHPLQAAGSLIFDDVAPCTIAGFRILAEDFICLVHERMDVS